jgi:small conductance mechanosensitive channel
VTGELRKRIKIAFDKEGIEIPYPQRVIHQALDK